MAVKSTTASVEKLRRGIQERTGVVPTARHSEIPSLKGTERTEQVLRDLGQTDVARGSNTFSVEAAKSGSPITSGWLNAYADNPKLAAAASYLAGAKPANDIFRMRQDQAMKGTLTNEMKSAGLTQEDIDTWNRQQNEKERQQVMSDWAKAHPIMTTLNAIPENAFGSIEGNIDKAIDYVKGNPIQSKETNADIYRRSVSENINSGLGRGAYGVANSIGDMLFAAWLTGGLGGGGATQGAKGLAKLLKGLPAAGVMGLEKSNQVMNDASERGLSNNQIAAEGLLSGASTALTEALPFSKFGEGGHIVGSMLAEGLQEGSEDLLDTFFDELVTRVGGNAEKSDLSTRYRDYIGAGYNRDEARRAVTTDYIKQVIMDTLAGGAAGGAMGGLGNFMGGRNVITGKIPSLNQNTEENVQTENVEDDSEEMEFLRNLAQEISEESRGWETREEQRNRIENEVANEVTAEKERVIADLENQTPTAGEAVWNFEKYINTLIKQNPEMRGYLTAELNDVQNMAEGWVTDYSRYRGNQPTEYSDNVFNSREEAQGYLNSLSAENNLTQIIERTKADVLNSLDANDPYSGEKVNDFITRMNYIAKVNPSMREAVNNAISEVNARSEGWVTDYSRYRQSEPQTQYDNTVFNSREEAQDYLNNLSREDNIAEVIRREEESVLNSLNANDPSANEKLGQFIARMNYIAQANPSMRGVVNNALNEVNARTDGFVEDYSRRQIQQGNTNFRSQEEAQNYLNGLGSQQNIPQVQSNPVAEPASEQQRSDRYEAAPGLIYGTTHITDNYIDIDGYSNKKTEKGLLGDLAKAVSKYDEGEAQNLRNSVKWNEISQYPGSKDNRDYILEWEDVPSASRNVDADGIDTILSNRDDTNENFTTESKPANYYVHIRFPRTDSNTQVQRDNEGLNPDVANIQTMEQASTVLDNEGTKLDRATHRFNLQHFAEESGEQEIPQVKDNGVHTGIYKTSKLATNSFPNSGTMTEEEYDRVIPEDIKRTERVTHEATLNKAEQNVKSNGYSGEYDRVLNDDNWDAVDVDTAMLCASKCADEARNAEALGIDPNEAWKREVKLFKKACKMATAGGQMIEAFKKWSSMTAEGKLAQAISYINETVKENKNELDLPKDVKTAAEKYLSEDVMAEFLKKAHQYDGQDVSLAKQLRLNIELAQMINQQIPVKFRQKFTSLWMDNLLASLRTLGSRNFGGNIGKAALDQTLVKMFSGPIDNFISRYTGTRTTTGFTMEGLKEYGRGFKKGAKQTIADYWTPNADPDAELKLKDLAKEIDVFADANVSNRSGVDETNFKETLKNNRTVFKNKALKLYDKCIKFGLAFGDNPFYKGAYDQTVLELNTLREQGKLKLPEDITDEQFETWVKAIATAQGLEAVYQDNTKLADGAAKIKQGLGEMSEGYIGVDILSGASMPFVRTPMNVIKTNLELSPLGIVKNAIQTISEIRANLENGRSALDSTSFRQARFVRETSRNLVGLILFAAGIGLKNAGLLTGGYSDDDREKQAQKESGMQEYALVNPFNGNQYSINWIPGLGSSLVSASAFEDAYSKPDQDGIDALANGIKAGSASMFEMAALQGLQRLTGSANYNSDNSLIDNVAQTVANTASSAILPSIVRQTAAALDPYKRNTYGTGGKESVFNNAIAGIPFLREQMLQPRIGMNGQPMAQNAGRNGFEKWFDNLVNPAMVTVPSALADPVRDEATRLYEATGSSSAYQPKIGINSLKTEDHTPTTEEYTEFLQIADSAMNQAASELIQSDYYAGLTDEQRVDTLNSIYTAVQSVEKARYLGTDKEFNGASKAYEEGGTQGLIDYFVAKNTLAEMGAQNNPENRELITETINNGTFDDMEQLGFDVNLIKKYQHAADRIPSLNPTTFQQQFNAIDTSIDGTGNNSITQKEIIAYLNQNPTGYNEEEALRIWDAYLQSYGKIPVFDPDKGTWSAK